MRRALFVVVLVMGIASLSVAQTSNWDYAFGPRFWGVSLALRYSVEPPAKNVVETSILLGVSGAWETVGFYRAPDGSLFTSPEAGFTAEDATYDRVDLVLQLGVMQGILPRSDLTEDQAVVFAIYRGRYDYPFYDASRLFFSSNLPEIAGSLVGAVVAGTAYSNVVVNSVLATKSGIVAELALEWGPAFLHNQVLGAADYARTTLTVRGYLPIFSLEPKGEFNQLSIYGAAFGAADWAMGSQVPSAVRSSIGGRSPRSAIGGSVRGYEPGRFDATAKLVANVEIRANLPALFVPKLIPGLVFYTDAGYYLDTDTISPDPLEESGYLLSSGAGVYIDIFDVAQLVFYTSYLWNETRIDGANWVPFSLGFGLHY